MNSIGPQLFNVKRHWMTGFNSQRHTEFATVADANLQAFGVRGQQNRLTEHSGANMLLEWVCAGIEDCNRTFRGIPTT